MTVRAKFCLIEITEVFWMRGAKRLKFNAEYDDTIPEDLRFQQATPSGTFEMLVTNPAALAQFKLGGKYYLDMVEVPSTSPKPAPGEGEQPTSA